MARKYFTNKHRRLVLDLEKLGFNEIRKIKDFDECRTFVIENYDTLLELKRMLELIENLKR